MKHGDISNELPKRMLVTTDVIMDIQVSVKKKLLIIPSIKINKTFRRDVLSYLYLYTSRMGVTLELVSYNLDEENLSEAMDSLDKVGTNPFRYFTAYESVNHLVNELPYRPEVLGVVDVDSRLLQYGRWGRTFKEL